MDATERSTNPWRSMQQCVDLVFMHRTFPRCHRAPTSKRSNSQPSGTAVAHVGSREETPRRFVSDRSRSHPRFERERPEPSRVVSITTEGVQWVPLASLLNPMGSVDAAASSRFTRRCGSTSDDEVDTSNLPVRRSRIASVLAHEKANLFPNRSPRCHLVLHRREEPPAERSATAL